MNENQGWYYAVGEETHGPVDTSEVENLIEQGEISPSTWIVAEGTENWVLAKDSAFADQFSVSPLEEGTSGTSVGNAAEHLLLDDDDHEKSGFSNSSRPIAAKFTGSLRSSLLFFRRRWPVLVPVLVVLGGAVFLLHNHPHRVAFRSNPPHPTPQSLSAQNQSLPTPQSLSAQNQSLPTPQSVSIQPSIPIRTVTASTPRPRMDAEALKQQYEALRSRKDLTKAFFSLWENEMARYPAPTKSAQAAQWITFQNSLDHYNSMILPSDLEVVQSLGDKTYEARFYTPFEPRETFVLLTTATDIQSSGRGELAIESAGNTKVKLKNGFERNVVVFREVAQDKPEVVRIALKDAALAFSTEIRVYPPDDSTLEGYIADINLNRANRVRAKGEPPRYDGSAYEDDVLYVCLQARLRNEVQPITAAEVDSPQVKPSASESPSLSTRENLSSSRVDVAQVSPSATPIPRIAKPGTYFLLQYASVKNDRGIYGFEPGQEVHLVRSLPDKGTVVVSDGRCELETSPSLLTNDLDVAAKLARADAVTQQQIVSRLDAEKAAARAKQHQVDIMYAKDLRAAEEQRRQNSRSRPSPNLIFL